MGKALEVIAGQVTFSNTVLTALTMNTGNSLTIRSASMESDIFLVQMWAVAQAAGTFRIRSPRMHDNVQGIRCQLVAGEVKPLLPDHFRQRLYSQDQLIAHLAAADAAADIEIGAALIYYSDLPGIAGRFIDEATLIARGKHLMGVENTIATGAAGDYSGEESLAAEFDEFKANIDYALLGYLVSASCGVVRWRGSDTGNLGVGGPGDELGRDYTASWFLNLSRKYELPMIPVFNAANIDSVLVDAHQDENGADVTVTSLLVELEPGAAPAA